MARRSFRNFIAEFSRLGIEYLPAKGPEVSDDIQMVQVIGDPILAQYGCMAFVTAVVGERGRAELTAGGNGLWLDGIFSASNSAEQHLFTLAASTGLANRVLPTAANSSAFGDGRAAAAIFDFGASPTGAPAQALRPNVGNASRMGANLLRQPIHIAAGRVLVTQEVAANLNAWVGLLWREIE